MANEKSVQQVIVTKALQDVISERGRQISAEGWTPEHDDEHSTNQLAGAAACYAMHVQNRAWVFDENPESYRNEQADFKWPWDDKWWKPDNPRRDLVKAGALILAEIERLDRANQNATVDDLSCLVRQLVHKLRQVAPDSDLPAKALDYLKRKGLQGSPLRSGLDQDIETRAKKIYEGWSDQPGYVPWQDGGNSLMQDAARQQAAMSAENIDSN